MEKINNRIINIMTLLYDIDEKESLYISKLLKNMNEIEKNNLSIFLYKRLDWFEKNYSWLLKKLKFVENDIETEKEHIEADNILLNI